jgi:hypothetical protein
VSFGFGHTLGRLKGDLPRKKLWRLFNEGSETDGFLGLVLIKTGNLETDFHDGVGGTGDGFFGMLPVTELLLTPLMQIRTVSPYHMLLT